MQVRDEAEWQIQRAEMLADATSGPRALEFLEHWLTGAEGFYEHPESPQKGNMPAAVNRALERTQEALQHASLSVLSNLLVIAVSLWKYGEELYHGMSTMELAMFNHALAIKVAEMQQTAEETSNEIPVQQPSMGRGPHPGHGPVPPTASD